MHPAIVIAKNTIDEARHNKILYIALLFFLFLILFSRMMGEVSINQQVKVLKDVGLATISIFSVFVAIITSVTSLHRDLNQKTIYAILPKPISRTDIIVGKFIGLCLTVLIVIVGMSSFLYLILFVSEQTIDFQLIPAIFLTYIETCIVVAIGLLFSSFSTPFLSGLFTMGLFLVGRISFELAQFGERSKNPLFKFFAEKVRAVYDLEAFNLRTEAAYHLPIYREDLLYPFFYAVFLVGVLVFASIILFRKRDFK